ncbi:MAG: homocysteine S-methyltransferase [Saprospiraceae bacterium]|nr:homocysteine S-methyltransferase [Saprospiraceae bacterium]
MHKLVNCLAPFLQEQGYLVLDGGLASELEYLGMDLNDPLWSAKVLLEQPEAIAQVHLAYLEAGADLITTASYQASYPGLANRGLDDLAIGQLLQKSVDLAKAVRDQYVQVAQDEKRLKPLVAASVGPYGAFLADGSEYTGRYEISRQGLRDFHRPRLAQLIAAEPDLLAIETIPCLQEAKELLELLKDEYPDQKAILSYSCRDGQRISSGEPFPEAVALANSSSQIMAVGINCTAPEWIMSLLEEVQGMVEIPLLVYPNRGEAWDAGRKCWIPGSAGESLANQVGAWHSLGAKLLGGCCRVRPADIGAIRTALDLIRA